MSLQTCDRCHKQEHIPTHQYVKFDTQVQYLCSDCWEKFREWFHKQRYGNTRGTPAA